MSLPSPTDDPGAFPPLPGVGATSSPQPDPPQPLYPLPSPAAAPADDPSLPPDPVTPRRPDEQSTATPPPSSSTSLQHAQPQMNFDSPATPKPRKPQRNSSSRPRPRRIVEDKDPLIRHTLQIEASNLPISDQSHRPAPFVALYCRIDDDDDDDDSDRSPGVGNANADTHADSWEFVGVTETADSVNPRWLGMFTIDSRCSENPVLRFVIYNNRKPSSSASSSATPTPPSLASKNIPGGDLSKHEYIGEIKRTITQIVLKNNKLVEPVIKIPANTTKTTNLKPFSSISTSSKSVLKQNIGLLTVRAEEQKGDLGETVTFVFSISHLWASHLRLKSSRKPFFLLSRKNRYDEEFGPVVQSEVHERYSRSDTTFQPVTQSIARLVNNDHDRLLRIEFFDYNRNGHSRLGSTTFTLRSIRNQLESSNGTASYTLRKQRSATGVTYDAGTLIVKKCSLDIPYTFKDYLDAGVSIHTVIAIDMSNTNGDPQSPSSFHYNNPEMPNEYVVALREVGRVLADYSTSKEFPAFGFGAVLPPKKSETSDCFALTGNYNDPACSGINDVIVQYYNALNQVGPYEPCRYGPVLDHVIHMTRDANSGDASAYDAWVGGGFDGWGSESNSLISKKTTVKSKQTNDHLESNDDIPANLDDEDNEYEQEYDAELSSYNDKDPTPHESSDLPTTNTNLDIALDSTEDSDDDSFDGKGPGPVYTILLIVTDGDFVDFEDVANLVCQAADLPLSIVIVGVGNSDFVKLERLDGDHERLCSSDGTPCSRDIVQFVRFHAHRYNPSQLAREVLEELPDQLVAYMRSQSIKPEDIDPPPLSDDHDRLGSRRPAPYFPNQNPSVSSSNIPSSSSPPSSLGHLPPIAATPALSVAPAPAASSSQLLLHTPQLQPHPSVQPQQSVQTQQLQVLATPQQQPLQHMPQSQPVQPQLQHPLQPPQQPQQPQMSLQNPLLSTPSLMPQQPGYGLMPPQTQVHPHAPYQSNQSFHNMLGASVTGYFPQQQMVYSSVGFPLQQTPITTMAQQHTAQQQQSQHFQNTNWMQSVQSVQQYPPQMYINSIQQQQQQQPQQSQQPSLIGQPQLTPNGMYPPNLAATQQQQQQQHQQHQLQPPGTVPSSTPWQHHYPSHGHRA